MPGFDRRKYASPSGLENGCGLYCIIHGFFIPNLLNGTIEREYFEDPNYKRLLEFFSSSYGVPNLTWAHLRKLFESYDQPFSREVILGPVFRDFLTYAMSELYADDIKDNAGYQNYFLAILNKCHGAQRDPRTNALQPDLDSSEYNLYYANKAYFNGMANKRIYEIDDVKRYWRETGYKQYAEYLGQAYIELSYEDLQYVTKALHVDLNVYLPSAEGRIVTQSFTEEDEGGGPLAGTLNIQIGTRPGESRFHWEFEHISVAEAEKHRNAMQQFILQYEENPNVVINTVPEIRRAVPGKLQQIMSGEPLEESDEESFGEAAAEERAFPTARRSSPPSRREELPRREPTPSRDKNAGAMIESEASLPKAIDQWVKREFRVSEYSPAFFHAFKEANERLLKLSERKTPPITPEEFEQAFKEEADKLHDIIHPPRPNR